MFENVNTAEENAADILAENTADNAAESPGIRGGKCDTLVSEVRSDEDASSEAARMLKELETMGDKTIAVSPERKNPAAADATDDTVVLPWNEIPAYDPSFAEKGAAAVPKIAEPMEPLVTDADDVGVAAARMEAHDDEPLESPMPIADVRELIDEMDADAVAASVEEGATIGGIAGAAITSRSDDDVFADGERGGIELVFGGEIVNLETIKLPRSVKSKYLKVKTKRYSDDPETIENTIRRAQAKLSGKPNGRREAVDLFRYVMGYSLSEIQTRAKELMAKSDIEAYEERVAARLAGMPMQYITKVQEFMGLPFKVSPDVLIPRLDTEVLAEQVIGLLRGRSWNDPDILDLCSGSGALGITLASEFPAARVDLSDISAAAMKLARENAEINGVANRCGFYVGNMFDSLPADKKYDVVVCNPPYIETAVIDTLDTEVKDHEPRLALDGGKDGLRFYRALAMESAAHMRRGGLLAMEIGNRQAAAVTLLLNISGDFKSAAVIKDLNGQDRAVLAERL